MAFAVGANTYLPPSPLLTSYAYITAITNSNPSIITVQETIPSNVYIPGQLIYLSIPFTYGMYQANAQTVQILSVNGNDFTVAMDSTQFDPFVIPMQSSFIQQPAILSSAGSRNIYNFTTLPFHSLNGQVGN